MRLRQLDLARYGCFTDFVLDFGAQETDKPDFHLVFGPNESGKSTVFSAFLDLLFGIEMRSQYGFLHDYRAMRIAASLDSERDSFDLVRIKRDNMSLLDADERPLPETLLSSPLGSLDRAGYTTMFSLDDDSLQSGGESILQSEGDLGRLLFSATSGLSDLSLQLDKIREETDAFHRPGGRATGLNRLKESLKALKADQQDRDTNARHFADLQRAADDAAARYGAAVATRDATRLRHGQVLRLLQALPIRADLEKLARELAPLKDLPAPPAGWQEEAFQLSQDAAAIAAEIRKDETAIAELKSDLAALNLDQDILDRAEAIERLKADEGRYRGAEDISARAAEREGVLDQIADLLTALGRSPTEDPHRLLLPSDTKGALLDLIETASGLDSRLAAARREEAAAKDALALAETALADLGPLMDLGGLEQILRRLRGQAFESALAAAEARRRDLRADIDRELEALHPWKGGLKALAALTLPGRGQVEAWRRARDGFAEERRSASQRQKDLAEKCETRRAEIAAIKSSGAVIDDDKAAVVRQARDTAWQRHRESLAPKGSDATADPAETADAFERTMAEDDRVVSLRGQQTAELVRLREFEVALAVDQAALAKLLEDRAAATEAEAALRDEMSAALKPLSLPLDLLPEDLLEWFKLRDGVLQKRGAFEAAEAACSAARDSVEAAKAELAAALTTAVAKEGAAVEGSLTQLMERAEDLVQAAKLQAANRAVANDKLRDCKLELQRRAREGAVADAARDRWQADWIAALEGCWMGAAGTDRKIGEVREILTALEGLPLLIAQEGDLARRIQAMDDDRARFVAAVRRLAEELDLAFEPVRVLEVSDDLQQRLKAAQKQADLRQEKQAQLERAENRRRKAMSALAEIDKRRAEMGDLFGVESFADLLGCLRSAEKKRELQERLADRESAFLTTLAIQSLEAAEAACSAAGDVAALDAERAALESRLETEEDAVTQLYHERSTAQAAIDAVGDDAAVARLEEERRTLLLDIEDQARRYLRLRVGALGAERALQIYRDRHRSAMMTRAADAFCKITQGRFPKLTTVPGKSGDVLVGLRANGASLLASEMSKGTRFQLYLALRIAGYHEYALHRETLPFLADDIMETFDDDRSAECFRLFAAMAEKGQVIYLTHHAHMRDMAKQVCGDAVKLHELPASYLG